MSKSCEYKINRPRHARLGSPERHLPSIVSRCGVKPAQHLFVRLAYVDRGISVERAEMHLCDEHARAWEARGASRFVRVQS